MKILDRLFGRKRKKRSYEGAGIGRLLNSWTTTNKTPDELLRTDLKNLRVRSRDLAINNDYARKFFEMLKTNVIGANGIRLQSKAKRSDGTFDKQDNDRIEKAWKRWGRKEFASVTGKLSWIDIQNVVVESLARDGEILVRKVIDQDNPYKFTLQLIECDHLDEDLNRDLQNGNTLRMGVELNEWGRPVNYWLSEKHSGDTSSAVQIGGKSYNIVPSNELLHLMMTNRPNQSRGVPWMSTAMTRLYQLSQYEEAEVVAARVAACKSGFFKPNGSDGYVGDGVDDLGNTISEASPGSFELLPVGMDFQAFDPTHPAGNFAPFIKATLRGIASGLGVSYNSLASDLEGVNFSSIRAGVLEERQHWKSIQAWMIEHFMVPVYTEWLRMALISNQLAPIPVNKISKFSEPKWQARGFEWIDPLKDAKANLQEIQMGTKSRADILAEKGKDIEEVFEQIKSEEQLAESVGINIGSAVPITEDIVEE